MKQEIDYNILKKDYIIINAALAGVVFLLAAEAILQHFHIIPSLVCIFHEVMHMYCPGCGGTRAFMALLRGDIVGSLIANPIVVIGAFLIAYYEIGVLVTLLLKNGKKYYIAKGYLAYTYLALFFGYAIVRNILLVGYGIDLLHDFIK